MKNKQNLFQLRPHQHNILAYRGGKMGISAVPGSGKTWTLSLLAADIIRRGVLGEDQEVLVVTLVNSAVDNFYQRVNSFIRDMNLLPLMGFRVRTLHGLAHDIVRERPGLVGLSDQFQIIDEKGAGDILNDVVRTWLHSKPYAFDDYFNPDLDENKVEWVRRDQLPDFVSSIAVGFIRKAKDMRLTPEKIANQLDKLQVPLSLAEFGYEIYNDYQEALAYRGAVDFDDLIWLALNALESDREYLERLRYRWPYILEDEAQDSSFLQEKILRELVGPKGNWVRVGDPNQAIYESFTTANPKYLRSYLKSKEVDAKYLPVSGRSTKSIIYLANSLVEWAQNEHPIAEVQNGLEGPPYIELVAGDDPQPNPPDDPGQVYLIEKKYTPQEEIKAVAESLQRWLPSHLDSTVAVLVPRNERGFELIDELMRRKIPCEDGFLRSTTNTRESAGVLKDVLNYLSDAKSASKLIKVYKAYTRSLDRDDEAGGEKQERIKELLRRIGNIEDFIWPTPNRDWLMDLTTAPEGEEIIQDLIQFRGFVQRWQSAILLPIDQMILTLSMDLLSQPAELAISHKLAILLRQAYQNNPTWRLPELAEELGVIARNERRFLGFSEADTGFNPEEYKGIVVVSTMHKAKGLEWDRVYLMSINSYDFPSGSAFDNYIAEKWFVRDQLNVQAETIAQLKTIINLDEYEWYQEGKATLEARLEYARERLRLLYVGITRAKRELVMTWNTGRHGDQLPAIPFVALQSFWKDYMNAGSNQERE